jgi:hypothetical protein
MWFDIELIQANKYGLMMSPVPINSIQFSVFSFQIQWKLKPTSITEEIGWQSTVGSSVTLFPGASELPTASCQLPTIYGDRQPASANYADPSS